MIPKRTLAAVLLLACTGTAFAQPAQASSGQGGNPNGGAPPYTADRAATEKILAEELAQRTGRKQADISAMLRTSHPPEVAQQLGIDRETMHTLVQSAHQTLIQRMLAAGLIDKEDAARLQKEPMPGPPGSGNADAGQAPPQGKPQARGGNGGWMQ